jgi:hypothetical protein
MKMMDSEEEEEEGNRRLHSNVFKFRSPAYFIYVKFSG